MLITKVNKGGAVVTSETKDYINEANEQLNVTSNYKKLPNDPRVTNNNLINDAIDWFKQEQLRSKDTAETLNIKDTKEPKTYKINNPGRTVLRSIGCHSTNIPKFVDYGLQPIVKNIPSYVQDSNDFLNKIDTTKKHSN